MRPNGWRPSYARMDDNGESKEDQVQGTIRWTLIGVNGQDP